MFEMSGSQIHPRQLAPPLSDSFNSKGADVKISNQLTSLKMPATFFCCPLCTYFIMPNPPTEVGFLFYARGRSLRKPHFQNMQSPTQASSFAQDETKCFNN
jgi:hypothetical protein